VLSILNKLTWTTFDKLVDEFKKLPIENAECLENIANIVAFKVNYTIITVNKLFKIIIKIFFFAGI